MPSWLTLAPYVVILLIGAFAGFERLQISSRDTTIAEKEFALANDKAQQAANIANAVKAVAAAKDADASKTTALVARLTKDKQDLQERANVAETALAAVPDTVTPAGCVATIDTPVFKSFIAGLPKQ